MEPVSNRSSPVGGSAAAEDDYISGRGVTRRALRRQRMAATGGAAGAVGAAGGAAPGAGELDVQTGDVEPMPRARRAQRRAAAAAAEGANEPVPRQALDSTDAATASLHDYAGEGGARRPPLEHTEGMEAPAALSPNETTAVTVMPQQLGPQAPGHASSGEGLTPGMLAHPGLPAAATGAMPAIAPHPQLGLAMVTSVLPPAAPFIRLAEADQLLKQKLGWGSGGLRPLATGATLHTEVAEAQALAMGANVRLLSPPGPDGVAQEVSGVELTGPVLALRVHGLEGVLNDPYVIKPVVRVHVVDARTGRYLRPVSTVAPRQYAGASPVMPHDAPPAPPTPAPSLLSKLFCGCGTRSAPRSLPSAAECGIPTRDDVVEPLATVKALNRAIETDVHALAAVAAADSGAGSEDKAVARARESITASETALLWNDVIVLNLPLAEALYPHVVLLVEVADDTATLPKAALQAGSGFYRVAWGFLRLMDERGKPTFDVSARVPVGFAPELVDHAEPVAPAPHDTPTRLAAVRSMKVALHAYQPVSWSDLQVHNASLPSLLPGGAAQTPLHATAMQLDPAVLSSHLPVADIPSPEVMLQYRMRNRQLLSNVLRVSCFGAVIPAVRYVHVQGKHACTYTYLSRDCRTVSIATDAAPHHHHHRRRHRRASICMEDVPRTHTHSYRHHPGLLRPPTAVRLPTDVPVSEPVVTTASDVRRPVPVLLPAPTQTAADDAAAGLAAARRSRLQRGPKEPCAVPDMFIASFPTGKLGALCVSFSPDGALLAVGCADDTRFPIRVYDVDSCEELASLQGHSGIIHDLSWSASSHWLASASADGTARVWYLPHASGGRSPRAAAGVPIPTRAAVCCKLTPPSYVYVARFHPLASNVLITGSYDRGLRVWDTVTDTASKSPPDHLGSAMSGVTLDGGLRGLIGGDPRDAASGLSSSLAASRGIAMPSATAQPLHDSHINVIEFDAADETAKRMVTADAAGVILIWDITRGNAAESATYTLIREMRPAALRSVPVVAIKIRPGHNQMLVMGHQNFLRLFDLTTFSAIRAFPNARCTSSKLEACFSPDGRYIATGAEDGVLSIWDVSTGSQMQPRARVEGGKRALIAYPGVMFGVAWHPTQHLLAVTSFGSPYPTMLVGHEPL